MNTLDSVLHVLWESADSDTQTACRLGIAGDFLPTMNITLPPGKKWTDAAQTMRAIFASLDVSIVNLETPVDVQDAAPASKAGLGQNVSAPLEVLDYLTQLGVPIVGIANNHMYDYGPLGVTRTRQALQAAGIVPLGSGYSLQDDPEIFVWQGQSDIRVGFWAAAQISTTKATSSTTGTEVATARRASQALTLMRQHGVACTVALLHAGYERTHYPDPDDVNLMQIMVREGFDLVAACHSHRISGYSLISRHAADAPAGCFYGLGSLSSGCIYSDLEREGLLVVADLNTQGVLRRIAVVPIFLAESGLGSPAQGPERAMILRRFEDVSAQINDGSYRQQFYREISQGLIKKQVRDVMTAFDQAGISGITRKLQRLRPRHLKRLWQSIKK